MNLRQPYEQLIAGKLRQLPAPDVEASWQQMKQLLDDEQDRGGGGKRPPGSNGWWRIGLLAVVLSASFWLYTENRQPDSSPLASHVPAEKAATKTKSSNNSSSDKNASIDQTTTLNDSSNSTNTTSLNQPAVDAANTAAAVKANKPNAAAPQAGATLPASAVTRENQENASDAVTAAATHSTHTPNNALRRHQRLLTVKPNRKNVAGNQPSSGAGWAQQEPTFLTATRMPKEGVSKHSNGSHIERESNQVPVEEAGNAGENSTLFNDLSYHDSNGSKLAKEMNGAGSTSSAWLQRLTGLPLTDAAAGINTWRAADSLSSNRDVSNLLSSDTRKAIAKAQRDQAIAVLDKKDKKFHLNLSNAFKPFSMRADNDPWWAAGLAINAGIPVGAQSRFNYNMNAKSGSITDYIPSPYLQYHVNDYVYFQTELNFVAPQYTPQLLLLRSVNDISMAGGTGVPVMQQKSVYVQKMYYFNWPVSLHYSPLKNLFFSGGIQFSSFQSGLATVEDRKYEPALGPDHASSITNNVLKFKDDSIAAKIAPNEWRWQLGAEYYINRFSIGLKYNQSFKKAINTSVSGTAAPVMYRNEALLFSIRYNLFESRNKKN